MPTPVVQVQVPVRRYADAAGLDHGKESAIRRVESPRTFAAMSPKPDRAP